MGPTENGWGVNFAHQGNQLFATWYTYDAKVAGNNAPLWLSALMTRAGDHQRLHRAAHPHLGAALRQLQDERRGAAGDDVGTATVTFTDGNHASFAYTTTGTGGLPVVTNQSKSITRFLFAAPAGTTCN